MGKIIGALIGWFTLGPLGAVLGLVAGHFFDIGMKKNREAFSPEQRQKVEHAFFSALFPVLGYLAKADGRVSEEEVSSTEELMQRMGLNADQRSEAIKLFSEGKQDDFDLHSALAEFSEVCARYTDLKRQYLSFLIQLALADGSLHEKETAVLEQVAAELGFSSFIFKQLMAMVQAQAAFRQQQQQGYQGAHGHQQHQAGSGFFGAASELETAYKALGLESNVSDDELKRRYRKLMSENHPDKLAGQGVPDEVVRQATERSQEIQTAYDLIKKSRKNK